MTAPTVVRWDTPGAPSLFKVASSVIAVLDFCLPQRGWEKVFTGTDKAVYRPPAGDRKFYRVLNDNSFYNSTVDYQYTTAKISIYDSMSDVDTGAGLTGPAYLSAALSNLATEHPWVVIVDESGFYFIAFPHLDASNFTQNTAIAIVQYFGETIPALPGNSARTVAAGGQTSMIPQYGSSMCCIGNSAGLFVNRSLDGTRNNITPKMQRNGGEPNTMSVNRPYGNSLSSPLDYPYNGGLLYASPMLDDALDYSMGDYVPGLYYPCHKGHTLNSFQEYSADGKTLIAFRVHSTNANITIPQSATPPTDHLGACLIEISAGFRP